MNLYDRYVDWASEKIAKHVIGPLLDSEEVWKTAEKLTELNDKVAERTGYDYLENCRKREEYNRQHPEKSALRKIGQTAARNVLLGGLSDCIHLHDSND